MGNAGHRRTYDRTAGGGDGHHAPKSPRMKESEDEAFRYVFTWLEGGPKGLGGALPSKACFPFPGGRVVFRYLGLGEFSDCPEFDFERCHWRFTEFENRGHSVFDSTPNSRMDRPMPTPQNFRRVSSSCSWRRPPWNHSEWRFCPCLLSRCIPGSASGQHVRQDRHPASPSAQPADSVEGAPSYEFDLAITFAGPQRPIAEEINGLLTAKGFASSTTTLTPSSSGARTWSSSSTRSTG